VTKYHVKLLTGCEGVAKCVRRRSSAIDSQRQRICTASIDAIDDWQQSCSTRVEYLHLHLWLGSWNWVKKSVIIVIYW